MIVNSKSGDSEIAYQNPNNISITKNHIYYYFVSRYLYSYTNGYSVYLHVANVGAIVSNETKQDLNWKKVSGIGTATETNTETWDVRVGKCYGHLDVIWIAYFDGAGLIDLTAAFGTGNEPSKEWCDANINYFDGSTSIYY